MKKPNTERLHRIADALGVEPADLFERESRTVPILGKVAAGSKDEEIAMEGQGEPLGEVPLPEQLRGREGIGAVLVEGKSMEPLIPPDSVLFFQRYAVEGVPTEALDRVCVVEDAEGRVWVKKVTQGAARDRFNLVSLNPEVGARLDVPLRWAAPVRLWLPPELVRR